MNMSNNEYIKTTFDPSHSQKIIQEFIWKIGEMSDLYEKYKDKGLIEEAHDLRYIESMPQYKALKALVGLYR